MKKIYKLFTAIIMIMIVALLMSTTSVRSARLVSSLTVTENLITPTTSTFIEIKGLDEVVNYADIYLPNSPTNKIRNDVHRVYADTVLKRTAGIINLTSLTNTLGEALDLTGEVIVAAKFFLQDDAAATCVISNGAATSYPLFGTTYSVQLQANQSILFKADTVLIPVSATNKHITYTLSNDTTALYIVLLTANAYH